MCDFKSNNCINFIFDKIFDKLMSNAAFDVLCFNDICDATFHCHAVHNALANVVNTPILEVKKYLRHTEFKKKFLISRLVNRINVAVLLNDIQYLNYLMSNGYNANNNTLKYVVLNNRIILFDDIATKLNITPTNDLLMYCSEYAYREMYFHLRHKYNLIPNICVYTKSILGGDLNIVKDIGETIGVTAELIKLAFESNFTPVVEYIIDQAINQGIRIPHNLIHYAIVNVNRQLIEYFESVNVKYTANLYYSALLSGSLQMVNKIECIIPNIHTHFLLDNASSKKGQSSCLLKDMIYTRNKKTYISHTMNYAIQSNNIQIIDHVYSKKYPITLSNICTSIKQSSFNVFKHILNLYNHQLPSYFIYYFGLNSHIPDKTMKFTELMATNKLIFMTDKLLDYKNEMVHQEMIRDSNNTITHEFNNQHVHEIDYLLNHTQFFANKMGSIANHKLIIQFKFALHVNDHVKLQQILHNLNLTDAQNICNALYLYGTVRQINDYYQKILVEPSEIIVMEILCYCDLPKICFMIKNNLLKITPQSRNLITILNNDNLNCVLKKMDLPPHELRFVVCTNDNNIICEWLKHNSNCVDVKSVKNILMLDDLNIIGKFDFTNIAVHDYIDWMREKDLIVVANYFTQQIK